MRFSSLGSGSRGNAALIEHGGTCILVDCGFSVIEVERRMERLGKRPSQLDAVLVTHEHSDHIKGIGALTRKYPMPVWMTPGTASAVKGIESGSVQFIHGYDGFDVGDICVIPFPVPHDAKEPSQFVFDDGRHRLGFLTDTGTITNHIVDVLSGCAALFLECNHDQKMLANGCYPEMLKQRVGGQFGHLGNNQAADLLQRINTSNLQLVVAAHLSEKNNTAQNARAALAGALDCSRQSIAVASQADGLGWHVVSSS